MSDLVEFLRKCVTEDEAVARSCEFPRWLSWIEGRDGLAGDSGLFLYTAHSTSRTADEEVWGFPGEEQDHAARWDPERVLAECKALRAVIELREQMDEYGREHADSNPLVAGSARDGRAALDAALLAFAQAYVDRPGWREEWRLQ